MNKTTQPVKSIEEFLFLELDGSDAAVLWTDRIIAAKPYKYKFTERLAMYEREGYYDSWQEVVEFFQDQLTLTPDDDSFGYEYGSISGTHGGPYMLVEGDLTLKVATLFHQLPEDVVSFSAHVDGTGVDLKLRMLESFEDRVGGHTVHFWTLVYSVQNNGN